MTAKGYCLASDVAAFLGKTFTAGQTTLCNDLIESAEADFDAQTGRGWLMGAQSNEVHYVNSANIFLKYAPVTSVTTVLGRPGLGETEETLTVDDDFEILDLLNGHLYLYVTGYDRLRVSYTPVATVPADIKRACVEIVANWMQPSLAGSFGLDSIQLPDYSVRFARSHVQEVVPPFAMQVIARYRYPVHG